MRVRAGDVQASLRRFGAATATATSEGGGAHAAPDGDAGSQSSRPCQSLLRLLRTFLTTHVVVSAALELDLPTRVIHASMWSSLCRRGVARTHERKRDGVLRPEKRSTVAMRGQEDARSKLAEEQTKMEAIRAQVDGERQAIALERQQLEAEKRAVGDLRRRNREELERTDAEKRVLQRERAALEEAREVTETLRAEREACDAELRRMRADNATLRQTLIDDEAVLLVRCAFPAVPFPVCGSEGVSVRECERDGQEPRPCMRSSQRTGWETLQRSCFPPKRARRKRARTHRGIAGHAPAVQTRQAEVAQARQQATAAEAAANTARRTAEAAQADTLVQQGRLDEQRTRLERQQWEVQAAMDKSLAALATAQAAELAASRRQAEASASFAAAAAAASASASGSRADSPAGPAAVHIKTCPCNPCKCVHNT